MKLTEITQQYNTWYFEQSEDWRKKYKKMCKTAACLILLIICCIGAIFCILLRPKSQDESVLSGSVRISSTAKFFSEEPKEITFEKTIKGAGQEADIQLDIPSTQKGRYQLLFYVKDKLVFQSGALYPGTRLPAITLEGPLQSGKYKGVVVIRDIEDDREVREQKIKVKVIWEEEPKKTAVPYIAEGGRG